LQQLAACLPADSPLASALNRLVDHALDG
jgi:hypothetical protein